MSPPTAPTPDRKQPSAFIIAVCRGNIVEVGKMLGSGADANEAGQWSDINLEIKTPAVMIAAQHNDFDMVRALIDAGADVCQEDGVGETALCYAVRIDSPKMVTLLLDSGADINQREKNGYTPITLAANTGREEIVKIFLERGANYSVENEKCAAALALATDRSTEGGQSKEKKQIYQNIVELLKAAHFKRDFSISLKNPLPLPKRLYPGRHMS